jgi:hypothetical protein
MSARASKIPQLIHKQNFPTWPALGQGKNLKTKLAGTGRQISQFLIASTDVTIICHA